MIKILFVAYSGYPNPNTGGSNKIIYEILKRLDYSKYSPSFFSYDALIEYNSSAELESDQKPKTFLKRRTGQKLYEKCSIYRYFTSSPLYLRIHFSKKDRFFHKHKKYFNKFDIIHIHNSLAAYYFIKLTKPKKILTVHSKGAIVSEMKEEKCLQNLERLFNEFRNRERIAYHSMDLITFPSNAAMQMYLKDLNLNKKNNICIIYNGIDLDYISNIHSDQILDRYEIIEKDYEGIILNVANHVREKNIDKLIKSIKILKENYNKSFLLVNAGVGYLTDELMKLASELKVSPQVKFLGQIPNVDVIRLMKVCDYFIMPSTNVVFDLVILEALAAGITILASSEGGNKEIIIDEKNGYLIEDISETNISRYIIENKIIKSNNSNNIPLIVDMVNNYCMLYKNTYSKN